MSLEDYLEEVREGRPHSGGSITLDPAKAREKLSQGRFQHRSEAFLSIIAAAILAESQRVRVWRKGSELHIYAGGQLPSREEFESLQSGLLNSARPAALRELGMALNSLYPRHASQVYGELWLGEGGLRGTFARDGAWVVTPVDRPHHTSRDEFPLHFWARGWSLLRHPLRWLLGRGFDEVVMLLSRTRWSPVPVEFDQGSRWISSYELSPPTIPENAVALFEVEGSPKLPPYAGLPPATASVFCWKISVEAGYTMRCAVLPGDVGDSALLLVYQGITMARHRFQIHPHLRIEGVICAQNLTLDAARQHIVDNHLVADLENQAIHWVVEGLEAWLESPPPASVPLTIRRELLELLFTRTELPVRLARLPRTEILRAGLLPFLPDAHLRSRLRRLPLFETLDLADGSQMSFDEVKHCAQRFDSVEYLIPLRDAPGHLHERPLLKLPHWLVKPVGEALGVPVHNAAAMLQLSLEPLPARLEGLPVGPLKGAKWEASVILPHEPRRTRLIALRKGKPFCRLDREVFPGIPLGVQIWLDGDYDYSFADGPSRLRNEVREALRMQAPALLDRLMRMHQLVGEGVAYNGVHFCSLLSLWLGPGRGDLQERWLDYTPPGFVGSLRQVALHRPLLGGIPREHPLLKQLSAFHSQSPG